MHPDFNKGVVFRSGERTQANIVKELLSSKGIKFKEMLKPQGIMMYVTPYNVADAIHEELKEACNKLKDVYIVELSYRLR